MLLRIWDKKNLVILYVQFIVTSFETMQENSHVVVTTAVILRASLEILSVNFHTLPF
jgi:hypothetical protein